MKTDKAREFWIYPRHRVISENKKFDSFPNSTKNNLGKDDELHVIEHTAVEQLEQKVKSLETELEEEIQLSLETGNSPALLKKLTASEARVKEFEQLFESAFDKWQSADWNYNQTKLKLAAQEQEIEKLKTVVEQARELTGFLARMTDFQGDSALVHHAVKLRDSLQSLTPDLKKDNV